MNPTTSILSRKRRGPFQGRQRSAFAPSSNPSKPPRKGNDSLREERLLAQGRKRTETEDKRPNSRRREGRTCTNPKVRNSEAYHPGKFADHNESHKDAPSHNTSAKDHIRQKSRDMVSKRVHAPKDGLWCTEELPRTTICSKQENTQGAGTSSTVGIETERIIQEEEEFSDATSGTLPGVDAGVCQSSIQECSSKVQEWDGTEAGLLLVPPNGCVDWMDGTTLHDFHANQKMVEAEDEDHIQDESKTNNKDEDTKIPPQDCKIPLDNAPSDACNVTCKSLKGKRIQLQKTMMTSHLSSSWMDNSMQVSGMWNPEDTPPSSKPERKQGGVKATCSPSQRQWTIEPSTTLFKKIQQPRRSKTYRILHGRLFHVNGDRVSADERLC